MNRPMRCQGCNAFILMEDSGWLIPHRERNDPKGEICRSREPWPSTPDEYPVGFDSDPWVYNGGLPTLGGGHR